MSAFKFETPYPSNVSSVLLTQYPRRVVITFTNSGVVYELRLENPQPLSAVVAAFDECYQFRVIDINGQLEFGRYIIELWDEDNCYADFTVDSFEQIPVNTASAT
ncbi:hypothetical protein OAF98_06195 [Planctomicrobium sp.]|nr:hypothetical protein [Planctomicrobium sp.]MDB4744061.1 hypothetical protein [Planctomicrobium sp.]